MFKRYPLILAGLFAAVSLGACQDRTEEAQEIAAMPTVPAAFPSLLLPPNGRLIASAGSEDALQLVFSSPFPADTVATYYRGQLATPPWSIVSDSREAEVNTIYAEFGGRPLWVRILPDTAGGSRVELNGAVLASAADSGAATVPASPASPAADSAPADPGRPAPGGVRRDVSIDSL